MAIDSLRVIKLNMVIAAIVLLAFWRPILSAETSSKAEALNRALAQAKSKVEAEKEIQDQTNDDISYRQKLEARITTEEEELPSELDALIIVMPSRGTESQEK